MRLHSRRDVLLFAAFRPLLMAPRAGGQTLHKLSVEFLESELKKFQAYTDDFRNAVHALGAENPETVLLVGLLERSNFVGDYLIGERYTVKIYNSLSCRDDQDAARPILREQTLYYGLMMGGDIEKIGKLLPGSKVLSTVQSGDKLRDEIRSLKDTFESFAASLA
jgi:hypothetical protein